MKKTLSVLALLALTGCASNNIKSFRVDDSTRFDFNNTKIQKIYMNTVAMPNDDHDSIMCRMAGNIYLPKKMKYSQYIADAFKKTLFSINKYAETRDNARLMTVLLKRVDFSSVTGKWYINADVTVDKNPAVSINTVTEFGTSYMAILACQNTAEAFDEAVANFIKETLKNPKINQYLR